MKHSILALALIIAFSVNTLAHASPDESTETEQQVINEPPDDITPAPMKVPLNVTAVQLKNLEIAYNVALKDGHKQPELLQAIVFQESKAGLANTLKISVNKFCFGLAQIKLGTAKDVLNVYPELRDRFLRNGSDREIKDALIKNNEFNISVASKYLLMLARYGSGIDFKAAAYNMGPGAALKTSNYSRLRYVQSVRSHMKKFKH